MLVLISLTSITIFLQTEVFNMLQREFHVFCKCGSVFAVIKPYSPHRFAVNTPCHASLLPDAEWARSFARESESIICENRRMKSTLLASSGYEVKTISLLGKLGKMHSTARNLKRHLH